MAQSLDLLLEETGKTIEELADSSGLQARRVLAIVDGRWLASPAERRAISRGMGLEVDDIAWGHTMPPRNVRYHQFGLKEDLNRPSEPE